MSALSEYQQLLSDVEYLERMIQETCEGASVLKRRFESLGGPYSESSVRLRLIEQQCTVAARSCGESFLLLRASLAGCIDLLEK